MGGMLLWILIGVIGGVAASAITRHTTPKDYAINIIVGIVGAVLGGFTANLVTRNPVFGIYLASFFVSILGMLVFLAVGNAMQRR
jgi:uncharacterized membrane protein YeaQ/YmgE (transglycosylase-associated protein family)